MTADQTPADNVRANDTRGRLARLAWLPVPAMLALIVSLWIIDPRTPYEWRGMMVALNVVFTWLASVCICFLTGRGFIATGQPGLLMFGCGSLLWGVTSLAAACVVDRINPTVTVHNVGLLVAGLCHLVGLLWRGRLSRPGRWLTLGYAIAIATAGAIFLSAIAGWTPTFFTQGHGGTPIRQVVLLLAIASFAWVSWRMLLNFRQKAREFYYWYGLGLALVATGLIGVTLLTVQAGILGWVNRLTQYLGSAYLFIAAVKAARETGVWRFSLTVVDDAMQRYWYRVGYARQGPWRRAANYIFAAVVICAALGLHLAATAWGGPGLPPYITFYPAVIAAAMLGGLGPGLLATACAAVVAGIWLLPPTGRLVIERPIDRLGLALFVSVGALLSIWAELSRRYREKARAYERETAVRESQSRLAALAAAVFDGLVESEGGRIVDCNAQFASKVQYSVEELRGMSIANLIAPADRERVLADIMSGSETSAEHGLIRKDGTQIVVEVHGRPMVPGGSRRLTALRDITARKRAEADLQHAKDVAESASRAKDQFIAVLSHELRTPLTPVMAGVSLLRMDQRLPPDVHEDLEMIARNLELEVRLIADLLDVSRIISGKLHIEKRPVDVADAIREAAKIVAADLQAREQSLTVETPGAPYLIFADRARLQQVFWNLLRNSIKFSPAGGHTAIRAKGINVDRCPLAAPVCPVGKGPCPLPPAECDAHNGRAMNLVVEVIDQGSGISPAALPRLFNAFEQEAKARAFGGLGLGLSICKAVVEMHGGAISAHSDGEGRGSTFTVQLPVAQCPLQDSGRAAAN